MCHSMITAVLGGFVNHTLSLLEYIHMRKVTSWQVVGMLKIEEFDSNAAFLKDVKFAISDSVT